MLMPDRLHSGRSPTLKSLEYYILDEAGHPTSSQHPITSSLCYTGVIIVGDTMGLSGPVGRPAHRGRSVISPDDVTGENRFVRRLGTSHELPELVILRYSVLDLRSRQSSHECVIVLQHSCRLAESWPMMTMMTSIGGLAQSYL